MALLLFGYIVVVPVVAMLYGDEADQEEWVWESESTAEDEAPAGADSGATAATDALERLRTRYAAGELTEAQFERKLEQLLKTETLKHAENWYGDGQGEDIEHEPDRR